MSAELVEIMPNGGATTAVALPTPMGMIQRAIEQNASIETLAKLMDLQERYERNQARRAFDNALASAKSEVPVILKNRTVDYQGDKGRVTYQHEDLAEIARTIDPILSRHGLSYRYRTEQKEGGAISVTCIISHRDGHSEENTLTGGRDESGKKNNLQAVGSTVTYLQRYTLKAALGLAAAKDDDAKTAVPVDTITTEQLATLRKKIEATDSDIAAFCGIFRIEALPDMQARDFTRAVALLDKKATRK